MQICVNGVPQETADSATVTQLVGELVARPDGVAVAVNRTVVPRSAWSTTQLAEQDQVEILTAAPGG